MAFITGIYTNLQPTVQSSVFFRTVTPAAPPRAGIFKYEATLEDGVSWLIYAIPSDGRDPGFTLISNAAFRGPAGWSGTIQVAKNPNGAPGEVFYDAAAGIYPTSANITGSVLRVKKGC